MSRPRELPQWARLAINDAKLNILPRFYDKEIQIYLYETNQQVKTINESKNTTIIIQSKLKQTLNLRYSSQSTEISTPKFENPADSAFWLNQIKGYIFQQLNINPNKYCYITINLDNFQTIKKSQKYRLIRNNQTYSNGVFKYAEILATEENTRTFPSLDKAVYELVNDIKLDEKITKIRIEFRHDAHISYNGIQIFTKDSLDNNIVKNKNLIKEVECNQENTAITFINLVQISPLLVNYLSWQNLLDNPAIYNWGPGKKKTILRASIFSPSGYISFTNNTNSYKFSFYRTAVEKITHNYLQVWTPPQIDYFTSNWRFNEIFQDDKKQYGAELSFNNSKQFVRDFLNGIAIEPKTNFPYMELDDSLKRVPQTLRKLKDLNKDELEDRKWFVLAKNLNLTNEFDLINQLNLGNQQIYSVWWKDENQRLDNVNVSNWQNKIDNSKMEYELTLERSEYSPLIKIKQIKSDWVKFTIWNKQRKLFEGTFFTNNKYDDSAVISSYQF